MEIIYKNLQENEISRELFRHFVRHQTVVKCRRKENGKWIIKDDPFIDDWSEAEEAQAEPQIPADMPPSGLGRKAR